jgi:hypothetical protein
MNTFLTALYRDVACAMGAVLITLLLGLSLLQSTSVPPGMHAHSFVALQPPHAWFGQPEPAVLVD